MTRIWNKPMEDDRTGRPAADGNPWKAKGLRVDQRGAKYQMNRRRFTTNPGYFRYLPRVFPFYVQRSNEDVHRLVVRLNGENLNRTADDCLCFAVTTHSRTLDGHVTLWLDVEAMEWLSLLDMLGTVNQSESFGKG